jgi:hypothetical protein
VARALRHAGHEVEAPTPGQPAGDNQTGIEFAD